MDSDPTELSVEGQTKDHGFRLGKLSELEWWVVVAFIAQAKWGLTIVFVGSRNGNGKPYARNSVRANRTSQFKARSLPRTRNPPNVTIIPIQLGRKVVRRAITVNETATLLRANRATMMKEVLHRREEVKFS